MNPCTHLNFRTARPLLYMIFAVLGSGETFPGPVSSAGNNDTIPPIADPFVNNLYERPSGTPDRNRAPNSPTDLRSLPPPNLLERLSPEQLNSFARMRDTLSPNLLEITFNLHDPRWIPTRRHHRSRKCFQGNTTTCFQNLQPISGLALCLHLN